MKKEKIAAEITAARMVGSVTYQNACMGPAPSTRAALASVSPRWRKEPDTMVITNGSAITACTNVTPKIDPYNPSLLKTRSVPKARMITGTT